MHHAIEWVRARLRKSDVLEQYWTYSLINESMINELSMFLGLITLGNQIGELFNTSFLETIGLENKRELSIYGKGLLTFTSQAGIGGGIYG